MVSALVVIFPSSAFANVDAANLALTAINVVAAITTVSLAVREWRRNRRREMAQRFYAPLRKEAMRWIDPLETFRDERPRAALLGGIGPRLEHVGDRPPSARLWSTLKLDEPDLARHARSC